MEIQKGEYIRTKDGYIGKVTRFTTSDICYVKFYDNEEWKTDIEEAGVVKHSFNIIDLIEEGDYVNGFKVISIGLNYSTTDIKKFFIVDCKRNKNVLCEKDIKSIVTKEQFKDMEYVIKEG